METSSAAGLPKNQLDSKISAGRVLFVVMGEIVAHFHLNTYVCTPTGLHQDISDLVVAGDHISTIFAGDCMVAKVIKYTGAQDYYYYFNTIHK